MGRFGSVNHCGVNLAGPHVLTDMSITTDEIGKLAPSLSSFHEFTSKTKPPGSSVAH
jgi:hypothetical protein